MNVSVDISMYPLTPGYIDPIKKFIAALKAYPQIEIAENAMTTQVFGKYQEVMPLLNEEMAKASVPNPEVVFVLKVIPFNVNDL